VKDWKYHCSVLGVRENANAKDVRRAYRRLALARHPDKHNNSTRSKEDFQNLHDSYQHLLDGIASGHTNEPATRDPHVDREAPTSPGFRMPTVRRNAPPVRASERGPAEGRAAWKMWLNAVAVGFAVLALTTWWEISQKQSPTAGTANRDLASRSWCLISKDGVETSHETFEYWTEPACRQRCEKLGATTAISCSWNSVVFHGKPKAPSTAEAAATAADISCEVTTEQAPGKTLTVSYAKASEAECGKFCRSMGDAHAGTEMSCAVKGVSVFHQERHLASPENPERSSAPMPLPPGTAPADATAAQMATICYVAQSSPGESSQESYAGETLQGCENRCSAIIYADPLGPEVHCAFNGKSVRTHVPDPTAVYLKQHPEAAGIRQNGELVNDCEIYTTVHGVRKQAIAGLASMVTCDEKCRSSFKTANAGSTITCSHGLKEFYRRTVPADAN
jgi:hypothetical protein